RADEDRGRSRRGRGGRSQVTPGQQRGRYEQDQTARDEGGRAQAIQGLKAEGVPARRGGEPGRATPSLDRITPSLQARRIGALVAIVVGLLLTLRLLGGLRRGAVVLVLSHPAGRGPHARADGRALPGTPTDGAADRSDRGAARRAFHRAALLWRRCRGRLRRLGGVEAGLLLGPVMAVELVLLEGLLALPRLRRHEHFGLDHAPEHPRRNSGDDRDRPPIFHVFPPPPERG